MNIEFRAWHKQTRKMLEWQHLLNSYSADSIFIQPEKFNLIIMQFTGMFDKNEVKIFEGDKVIFTYKSDYRSYSFTGVVERDTCNPCFVIVNPDNDNQIEFDWVLCNMAILELVGNIHE